MPKIYMESYGCSANQADFEIMKGMLRNSGYVFVNFPEESEVNLINTCAVKTPTENKMIQRIKKLSETEKPLIVSGCMAKAERKIIEKVSPESSLLGPQTITKVVEVADSTLMGKRVVSIEDLKDEKISLPHIRTNPVIDVIEMSSGCLSSCTFCITKLARGHLHSYRPNLIREQIRQAVSEGCREIWLTSQDASAYGREIGTSCRPFAVDRKHEGKFFAQSRNDESAPFQVWNGTERTCQFL